VSAYKDFYGKTVGESRGIQEHTLAMIPVKKEAAEAELLTKEAAFAQEVAHIKTLSDILGSVPGAKAQQIVYSQAAPSPAEPINKKYALYAAIALIVWVLFLKRGQ